MEPVIPALHAFRRGVGDVLPALRPAHLVAFALHQGDEFLAGFGVPHALVDGVHQPELPALSFGGGAVLTGAHPFLLGLLFRRRQDLQTVGGTDFITGQPVVLEVGGALVEFPAVLKADAVDDQVAVQVVGVYVGGHQYLKVGELPLGQLQSNGVGLLGRQVIRFYKGLDEVVVLPPVGFAEPLLGEQHFREGGLSGAVPAGYQPLSVPQRFSVLLGVPQHSAQRAPASTPVLDGGEGCHLVDTSSISFASSLIS